MGVREAGSVRPVIRGRSVLSAIALVLVPVLAPAQAVSTADSSFQTFLPTFEAATRSFLDGDNTAWKELLSAEPGVRCSARSAAWSGRHHPWPSITIG